MAYVICLWQWNDATLDVPTQDDLMFRHAVFFSQAFDDRMVKNRLAVTGEWRPSHAYYLMLSHQLDKRLALVEWVTFNLVHHRFHIAVI